MFTKQTYEAMLSFHPTGLINTFFELYAYEYSEKKINEIIVKAQQSDHIRGYLHYLRDNYQKPKPKELITVFKGASYFLFSKAQTICIGGLSLIHKWYSDTRFLVENEDQNDKEVAKLITDFIVECNELKLNVSANFFDRFYEKVKEAFLS